MRKIKEILRLHFEQKLGQRQIARSVNTSQSTVHEYLARMKAAGLQWPLGEDWGEQRLEEALFPPGQAPSKIPQRAQPDCNRIRQQLEQHRDLTLELLWEEYREQHPDGYSYSRFCKLYRHWKKRQDVVMRQDHAPARNCFSTEPAPPSPSTIPTAQRARRPYSFPPWALPATPTPRP